MHNEALYKINYIRMKKVLMIFSSVIMTTLAMGQDLEISVAPTVNFPVYKPLEGGASHNSGTGFSATFGYLAPQKQFIAWTIGLGYHFVRIRTDPMFNGVYDPLPYTKSNCNNRLIQYYGTVFARLKQD